MADDSSTSGANGNGSGANGGAPADQPTMPRIAVRGQYVKDLSFENPRAPDSFAPSDKPPEINVQVNVNGRRLADDAHEVEIQISARASQNDDVVFITELTYAGVFGISDVTPNNLQPVLMIECPRLLFPFARRIVADCTRDGGFPPLLLEPIDFMRLYMQHQEQRRQTQASADAATETA